MKLFLVFLLVASCQARSFFEIPRKEVTEELVKEYPTEDPNELREPNHKGDTVIVSGSKMDLKVEYGALERRDIWGDLNDTLHRMVGHLTGKFSDLKDFFHKTIKIGAEEFQPHLINIKKLAEDLLNNVSVVNKNVCQQALEFFRPFHKQLGDLWIKLVTAIHDRLQTDQP